MWIATEVFLKWPPFFLCGSKADVRREEFCSHVSQMFLTVTTVCYRRRTNLGASSMGRNDQKPENAKAEQEQPLAKRIAALQERARPPGNEQPLTWAELKAFMDDQWGEGEDEDRQPRSPIT